MLQNINQDIGYFLYLGNTPTLSPCNTHFSEIRKARTEYTDIPGFPGTLNATCRPHSAKRYCRRSQPPTIQEGNQGHYLQAGEHATKDASDSNARCSERYAQKCWRAHSNPAFSKIQPAGSTAGCHVLREVPGMRIAAREIDSQCSGGKELPLSTVGSTQMRQPKGSTHHITRQPKTERKTGNPLPLVITSDRAEHHGLISRMSGRKDDTMAGACRRTKSQTQSIPTPDAETLPGERLQREVLRYLCQEQYEVMYIPSVPLQDTEVRMMSAVRTASTFLEGMKAFLSSGRAMASDIILWFSVVFTTTTAKFSGSVTTLLFFYSTDVSTK